MRERRHTFRCRHRRRSPNGVFAESYAYDALGRRVSTTTLEGAVRHVYDDSWQCIADIDENGNVLCSYVWGEGIDKLLAVKIGGNVYYPLTDIQGTVWCYADSANNIVARWTYDAWGNVLSEDVAIPVLATLRYRFQGREWSAATGLVNFRMRWYDAETARWLSKDPIGLSGGFNLYVFCGNRPILYVDPRGLMFMVTVNPDPEGWGTLGSTHQDGNEDTGCGKIPFTAITLPRLPAPSGNEYQGDPFGHGTKPGTQVPKDAHVHQYPPRGPKRIFNLDGTPRDDGPKLPKRDKPVFERVVNQVMRMIRGLRLPAPAMFMPPQPVELPDGRLGA